MRTVQNKAIMKALDEAEQLRRSAPTAQEQCLTGIAEAQEAKKTAAAAKESAQTEEDYNKACEAERRAIDKETFYKRQYERFEFTPRMDEKQYNELVNGIVAAVEQTGRDFRQLAEKYMADLALAYKIHKETMERADEALTALDEVAHVLQSKYRYEVLNFVGEPSRKVESRDEWKRHTVRFVKNNRGYDLATMDEDGRNRKAWTAWKAVLTLGEDQ